MNYHCLKHAYFFRIYMIYYDHYCYIYVCIDCADVFLIHYNDCECVYCKFILHFAI